MGYKLIQMTNKTVGAKSVNDLLPLGKITRRIANCSGGGVPFDVFTAGADTVNLTAPGYYRVTYSLSAVAGANGTLSVSVLVGDSTAYTASATAASGASVDITIPYIVRVFGNCNSCPTNCPLSIQFQLGGVAITGGVSNLMIERVA